MCAPRGYCRLPAPEPEHTNCGQTMSNSRSFSPAAELRLAEVAAATHRIGAEAGAVRHCRLARQRPKRPAGPASTTAAHTTGAAALRPGPGTSPRSDGRAAARRHPLDPDHSMKRSRLVLGLDLLAHPTTAGGDLSTAQGTGAPLRARGRVRPEPGARSVRLRRRSTGPSPHRPSPVTSDHVMHRRPLT